MLKRQTNALVVCGSNKRAVNLGVVWCYITATVCRADRLFLVILGFVDRVLRFLFGIRMDLMAREAIT